MQKRLFIETYGCQMNVADSEVVVAILREKNYILTSSDADADAILIYTCSVRDNAEQRIWGRLHLFKSYKRKRKDLVVGVIGCMAERLGDEFLQHPDYLDWGAERNPTYRLKKIIRFES